MAPVSRRTVLAALAAAPALAAVGCGGRRRHPVRRGGGRTARALRHGLDAQHQPHRAVRRAAAGLVRRRRAGRADPAVQLDVAGHARVVRCRRVRHLVPGLVHGLEGRGRGHRLGAGGAAALGHRDRHARRPGRPRAAPRDLDGKTYGGFGAAYEVPKMQAIIRAAGGKGDFKTVVLGTVGVRGALRGAGGLHRAVPRRGRASRRSCGTSRSRRSPTPTTASPTPTA